MILDKEITGFTKDTWHINEVQELVEPYRTKRVNLLVASETGTGKTTIFCMKAHYYAFVLPEKMISVYIAPTKALVEEKKDDFQSKNHPYHKLNVVAITGDYGEVSKQEMLIADIVLMTPEAFSHRVRNYTSDKHDWLHRVGLLCIDEFHIIDDLHRGSHIEASLMNFCRFNPKAELLCLSATIPNKEELTEWIDLLNDYDTQLIYSEYRPTKLEKLFVPISKSKGETTNDAKLKAIKKIVAKHGDDQAIVGVFNRNFGYKIEEELEKTHKVGFHHGVLNKSDRSVLEKNFTNKSLQIMVSTSTLFAGVNFPVDYVIATSEKAGGGDIKAYQLNQMAGRAGRPQYNKDGFCYFFIEEGKDFERHKARILNGEVIRSQMGIPANVALHVLGCINSGIVHNLETFVKWFKDSLYYHQQGEGGVNVKNVCAKVETALADRGMIVIDENDRSYSLSKKGLIATQMSVDPLLLADLIRNFNNFFKSGAGYSNINVAKCLGQCLTHKSFCSDDVKSQLSSALFKTVPDDYKVSVASNYYLLSHENAPKLLLSNMYAFKNDFSRICATLSRINNESSFWGAQAKKIFNTLPVMVRSKVDFDTAYLISQGATPFQAKRLRQQGFTDLKEIE